MVKVIRRTFSIDRPLFYVAICQGYDFHRDEWQSRDYASIEDAMAENPAPPGEKWAKIESGRNHAHCVSNEYFARFNCERPASEGFE